MHWVITFFSLYIYLFNSFCRPRDRYAVLCRLTIRELGHQQGVTCLKLQVSKWQNKGPHLHNLVPEHVLLTSRGLSLSWKDTWYMFSHKLPFLAKVNSSWPQRVDVFYRQSRSIPTPGQPPSWFTHQSKEEWSFTVLPFWLTFFLSKLICVHNTGFQHNI